MCTAGSRAGCGNAPVLVVVLFLLSSQDIAAQGFEVERLAPRVGNETKVMLSTDAVLEVDLSAARQQLIESATNRSETVFLSLPEARCPFKRAPSWAVFLCGAHDVEVARTATRQSVGWEVSPSPENLDTVFWV